MYSCALWGDSEGGIDGDLEKYSQIGDLEAAQLRKIHHVLRKARVKPGHRLLEFGSGWGGLAIEVLSKLYLFSSCILNDVAGCPLFRMRSRYFNAFKRAKGFG